MLSWLKELDELLRGAKTRPEMLSQGASHLHLGTFFGACVVLGVIYGVAMGLFGGFAHDPFCWEQLVASGAKVPMLFLLTLVVTLPSLYVFSALLGVRVTAMDTLRIIVAAIAVNLTLLASFAPITAFFTLSTDNYFFMKLLNVLFFTIAGIISLKFLSRMMWAMEQGCLMREVSDDGLPVAALAEEGAPNPPAGARAPMARLVPELSSPVKRLFRVWLVMYAVVGAQMAWVLRPFVGAPNMEFTWFREKQANFFLDILRSLHQLLS